MFINTHTHQHRVQVAANNVAGPGQGSAARGKTGNHGNRISHWGSCTSFCIVL